jgi:hypothetical protein
MPYSPATDEGIIKYNTNKINMQAMNKNMGHTVYMGRWRSLPLSSYTAVKQKSCRVMLVSKELPVTG